MLDAELNQLATVAAPLHKNGVGAFDPTAGVYYFAEDNGSVIKAVDVTPTSLGTVREVSSTPAAIRAMGYNSHSNKVAVISQNTGADKTAHLSVIEAAGIRETTLPSTAELIGQEIDPYSDTVYTPNFSFGSGSLVEMLPMPDGTFILNSSAEVTPAGANTSLKDLLVSIDPVGQEPAKYMPGSKHGSNRYLRSIAANGSEVIRWVMNGSAEHSYMQILRYENRDVIEVSPISNSKYAGIAGLNWDKDNQPVLLDGSSSALVWLNSDDKSVVLPNGRETYNKDHGVFFTRADGSFYVQTLDESNDDHEEKYVLVRLYNSNQPPTPTPPGDDGNRLRQLRIARAEEAVNQATEASNNATTEEDRAEALEALEKARKELADAKGETYTPLPAPSTEPSTTEEPSATTEPSASTTPSTPAPAEPDAGSANGSTNGSSNGAKVAGIIAAVNCRCCSHRRSAIAPYSPLF